MPAGDGARLVAVQTLTGADGEEARGAVAAAGARVRADSNVGGLTTQFVELSGAEIDALATDPAVVSVTPYSMPELLDERSGQIVAGNLTADSQPRLVPDYLTWLGTKGLAAPLGFAIDVTDTGLDNGDPVAPGHPDFYVNGIKPVPSQPGSSRVAYAHEGTSDAAANDCSGHGTNVASIAAGFGAGTGFRTRTEVASSTAWAPHRGCRWSVEDLQVQRQLPAPGRRLHDSGGAGVRRGRAYLEQLVGQRRPRPLQSGLARIRLPGARRPARDRRQRGDGRGIRRRERRRRPERRGKRGLGEYRFSRNGQERHHRRRVGELTSARSDHVWCGRRGC